MSIEEYVARIENPCGKERDFFVMFKQDKKDEATMKILKKAKVEKSISRVLFELSFKNITFRLYGSGKAIFRNLDGEEELRNVLVSLLK